MPAMPAPRLSLDAEALARVVERLGHDGFGAALIAWLAPALQPAHATAFRYDSGLQARVVMTASAGGGPAALQSARVYAGSGLARLDRLRGLIPPRGEAVDGNPAIVRLRREEIADTAYREQLWDRFGLVDRVSALALVDGHWSAFNLYRDRAGGPFGARELARFAALAPLLLALLGRHLDALQPAAQDGPATRLAPEAAEAMLRRLPARLSAREREVCALTLAGHTREGIGLALGIAPSSVATLRRRAYGKLAIHGAGELFALCLNHAPR
ncbi:helix-turn-helix transcriptional regulator [Piscinibacter sp.]|uniref:helix-turn-helix transcriptional regulator n=1 Tax=Piscinibacter sp. TaxID=1903157 RepID=UPI0039E46FA1